VGTRDKDRRFARAGNVGERARPGGDAPHQDRPMPATPRTDVTVGEVQGRTVAARACAADGNFSPLVAVCGTSATDPLTSPGVAGTEGTEETSVVRAASGPVPLPRAAPHQVASDAAEAPRRDARSGQGDVITASIKAILERPDSAWTPPVPGIASATPATASKPPGPPIGDVRTDSPALPELNTRVLEARPGQLCC
jgi:hypothetical protein